MLHWQREAPRKSIMYQDGVLRAPVLFGVLAAMNASVHTRVMMIVVMVMVVRDSMRP